MTTPTPSRSVSTPKHHATPGRMMASPRPGTAAGKTLAHKSPATATKTPASNHGHFHGLSASSQPSSTPLAAAAIHDELLNLNSPAAALINSIAQNGLTPLGGGQDGLGISTQNQLGAGRDSHIARTPAEERLRQLEQAIDSLKTKVVGRGITRDGIERVARLHGFEALWDEDNLVIAGKMVEIEITFASIPRDTVRDLSFKLNYDDDQHVQQAGTAILKNQAGVTTQEGQQQVTDLTNFANNIQYLAQLDPIEVKPNSFQLVDNLYHTFRDIWREEKKRMQWRNGLHHVRHGSLGVPNMDRPPALGLTVGYWHREQSTQEENATDEDNPPELSHKDDLWKAKISGEAGLPFINASKDWVSSKILADGQPGQNVLDAGDSSSKPEWRDFSAGVGTKADSKDESGVDADMVLSGLAKPLHVHFICDLQPEVLLPLNAIGRFNTEVNMIEIDPQKACTYPRALQKAKNLKLGQAEDTEVEPRWSRRLPVVDGQGKLTFSEQSYRLYSSSQDTELWCYPTSRIRFNHPRQLAEMIPVLRQYVVVWSMLRALVLHPSVSANLTQRPRVKGEKKIIKRSNKPIQDAKSQAADGSPVLNVDILLDVLSDAPKARLEIFTPVTKGNGAESQESMLHLTMFVSPGGLTQVTAVEGVNDKDLSGLKTKLGKMLSCTEDPGIVLQWLVDRAKEQV